MHWLPLLRRVEIVNATPGNAVKLSRWTTRAGLVALILILGMMAPERLNAQQDCAPVQSAGCFIPPKRDVAFVIDRSRSISMKGQTYNIEIEGVIRALSDPTVIPRDGSTAIAVITFSEAAEVNVPLTVINSTPGANAVIAAVTALKCPVIGPLTPPCPFGGTSYTAAIQTADNHLNKNRREGARRILLMSSDGEPEDPDFGVGAATLARNAAATLGISFELDMILVSLDTDSATFAINKAKTDLIVSPPPAATLPGATLAIDAGDCNLAGAAAGGVDCDRQANEFAELTHLVLTDDVTPVSLVVTTEADTAPPGTAGLSLRQAIQAANCNGGKAVITFADNVRGKIIRPLVPLPALTSPEITIDGCKAGDCSPAITIDGTNTDVDGGERHRDGILIRSSRNTVRGLRIMNFRRAGVAIDPICSFDTVGRNRVELNSIEGNQVAGVLVKDPAAMAEAGTDLRNTLSRNAISASATLIDLGGDGSTANDIGDPDVGPNTLLNFPQDLTVFATGTTVTVTGKAAAGATCEIFGATGSQIVSGKLVLAGVIFMAQTRAGADGTFTSADVPVSPTGIYTATAIDAAGNTSELIFDSGGGGGTGPATPGATVPGTKPIGDVPKDTTSDPQPIPVDNPGKAPLIITGCAIVKCDPKDRDDTSMFTVTGCPTGPINPSERVVISVRLRPTVCGPVRACLKLTTNDPQRPMVIVELTGRGVGPAQARLTLEGGASSLEFGPVSATLKGRKAKKRPSHAFTIDNTGCADLIVSLSSTLRTGSDVASGGISNADDQALFQLSIVNGNGTETTLPAGSLAPNISPGGRATFRVRFNPIVPAVASSNRGLSGGQAIPDLITSRLTLNQNGGNPLAINLVGRVNSGVRLISPTDPRESPVIGLNRDGVDFSVDFSVYDANPGDVNHARYEFLNKDGNVVGDTFDIDLVQAVSGRSLVRGQSFTVTQRFAGSRDSVKIVRVRVTVFGGSSSEMAKSP